MMEPAALRAELEARALKLGFARVGVARAEPLKREGRLLERWLELGRHGSMGWMADTAAVRADVRHGGMLPAAESVVVLVAPYGRASGTDGPAPARVARYALGRDYHNVLQKRLRKLAAWLRELGHETRAAVDSMPVFERAWAERAGVGFVGKNACLIVPGLGSHVFLAALVTGAALEPDAPMAQRCGDCVACLDACPTEALVGPGEVDGRRCISYLTIEHRGPIEPALEGAMGDWMFGCDACQDPCPFNRTSPAPEEVTAPFAPHERWQRLSAADFLTMEEGDVTEALVGSPLKRAGAESLARNAAIALGHAGDRHHLPILDQAAKDHPSTTVREAATRAATRIRQK